MLPAKVPAHLQLKAPVEKILLAKAKGDTISYLYASNKKVLKAKGEDISKRTKNAQFFPQGEQTTGKFFAGEPFYKDGADWFQTETATTTKASFEKQTKISLLDKVLGKQVFADSSNVFAGAGDGEINKTDASWDTTHDATTGNNASYGGSQILAPRVRYSDSLSKYYIYRAFLPFDTSGLPDGASISEVLLKIYIFSVSNGDDDGNDFTRIVQTDQPDATTLATADYNNCGATNNPTAGATDIDFGSITASQYNTFTLNATGRSWIVKDGWTKLGIREGHDAVDDAITIPLQNYLQLNMSEYPDTNKDPYLEITYTTGGAEEAPVKQDIIWFH